MLHVAPVVCDEPYMQAVLPNLHLLLMVEEAGQNLAKVVIVSVRIRKASLCLTSDLRSRFLSFDLADPAAVY